MTNILIFSQDWELGELFSRIAKDAGYSATYVQTMEEIYQAKRNFELLIIVSSYNLTSADWEKLEKLKFSRISYLPIVIADTPLKDFLQKKLEARIVDIVLPYPCGPEEIKNAISDLLTN